MSIDFKDTYFHIHIKTSQGSTCLFTSRVPIQSTNIRSIHSIGIHRSGEGGQTVCITKGYKNPPVPRRLFGQSKIPSNLSPAYTNSSSNLSGVRLVNMEKSELDPDKSSTLSATSLTSFERGQGQNYSGALADLNCKNTRSDGRTDLSGLATEVPTEKQVHLGRLHMRLIQ